MSSEQVCLKWNNFPLNITKNIDDLWNDESLVDVSLISDGQCIQAHKVILSASSPLFKSLFAVNPCQHPIIILQDVRFRELVAIIKFIYKGEVNILEENLLFLLQAAKTLQIHGLSDSVDKDNLDRLYSLNEQNENEHVTKKRKTTVNNNTQNLNETIANTTESMVVKKEPKLDNFPLDFLERISSDEEHVQTENFLTERIQEELEEGDGETQQAVGKRLYQQMPYANLLPAPEIIQRWSESRSLDHLAIDLMKHLFTTEERLLCNVNGKMGKPRFHLGKISLLREVLYYYSGLTAVDFEIHWKNCVTKIDTSNRGLKRNKKLRTKMFFMNSYLAKTFS